MGVIPNPEVETAYPKIIVTAAPDGALPLWPSYENNEIQPPAVTCGQ
jgi:hypothetical protein